jgi:hypothetical protein
LIADTTPPFWLTTSSLTAGVIGLTVEEAAAWLKTPSVTTKVTGFTVEEAAAWLTTHTGKLEMKTCNYRPTHKTGVNRAIAIDVHDICYPMMCITYMLSHDVYNIYDIP